MGLRDLYNRFVRRSNYSQEIEDRVRAEKKVNEKQLSSDERELNKFVEEERQKNIKSQLSAFRKRKQEEIWHGTTALDAPNVIHGQKNLFSNRHNIFGWKSEESQKNLFWN